MTSADIGSYIKKHPVGFACGLISVILAGALYFRSSLIEEKQTDYETKSAAAAKIISNVNSSKNLSEQVQEIQALTKDLESRLVSAGQLAVNLQYFYKLEAETEVKLVDVRQNIPAKKSATIYTAIPYSVTVQGSYKQVMVFLNRLENGRHLCHLTSAVFGKVVDNSSPTMMSVTLTLELLGQP